MKVRFEQSGGFAGLVKGCEINQSSLSEDEANELTQLVQQSEISDSGEFFSDSARDLYQYEITIEDGDSKIHAVFDDKTLPASAKPLVGYLKKCSRPKPLE